MAAIETIKGLIDEAQLTSVVVAHAVNGGTAFCREYFLGTELVRRDIHVKLLEEREE